VTDKMRFVQTAFEWPRKLKLRWVGEAAYVDLDADRFARIGLSEDVRSGYPTSGTWVAFQVTVVSKTKGTLGRELFPFNEHLEMQLHPSNPNGKHVRSCHVISYCGWQWHINEPVSTKPLMKAISDYINLWRTNV